MPPLYLLPSTQLKKQKQRWSRSCG